MFVHSSIHRLTPVLAIAICVCLVHPVPGAKPAQSPEQRQQKIEQLIEQLASENPEPKRITNAMGDQSTEFAPGYREKQVKVDRSAAKLRKFSVEAVPSLIEHFDDERYSYSEGALNARDPIFYSRSVGAHCKRIVRRILCHYDSWGDPMSGFSPTWHGYPELATKKSAQKWWARNKDKPLWQLQADILKWAIDLELKTKQKDNWNAEDSKKAVEANRKVLDELLKTKKPL